MRKNIIVLIFFVSLLYRNSLSYAQGELMVSPMRIELDDYMRRIEVSLTNNGADTTRYLVTFAQYVMREDGRLEVATPADTITKPAKPFLQVFPNDIVLPPKEGQVISVVFKKRQNIPKGEYASRLCFKSVVNSNRANQSINPPNSGFQIIPVFGITIPVFVRVGELSGSVSFSDVKLDLKNSPKPMLSLNILRNGEVSFFGDILVEHTSLTQKTTLLGLQRGVAVYLDVKRRFVKLMLDVPTNLNLKKGMVTVKYIDNKDHEVKPFAQCKLFVE